LEEIYREEKQKMAQAPKGIKDMDREKRQRGLVN
jgi:hypothetical protein